MPFRSDEILWYNQGVWGSLGFAVPNFGDDPTTLNSSIAYLVEGIGRNLAAVMVHSDADSRIPPSINTLMRVHKLITRARSILAGRALAPSTLRMEPAHATPAVQDFLIFPCPFFKVRNTWLKEWCGLILNAIGEMCQHTENRVEYEISTDFAGVVGQYLQRVYVRMSTELFQVPLSDAQKPDFTLTDAIFSSYNPGKYFTSTELIDTVPPMDLIPTEDDLAIILDGIPATKLVGVTRYPSSTATAAGLGSTPSAGGATVSASASASFVPPPSP